MLKNHALANESAPPFFQGRVFYEARLCRVSWLRRQALSRKPSRALGEQGLMLCPEYERALDVNI